VAGEARLGKVVYLAITSRLLQKPVSVAVKGPSSGGKSYTVEQVLRFFPDSAYYALTAMSERALAYSEEPLKNRILTIYEASGMEGDMQTYLIRSLLSGGRIRYEVVEKTSEGMRPRLIEREGPTGLLVTTTAPRLHPENETRLLSLTVTDTQEQTRGVLAALAEENRAAGPDLEGWRALQGWLETQDNRVTVPYSSCLANLVPPIAVRLRRDFGALLNLIRAHAVLHRSTRETDQDGRVVATVEDYARVRELVADLVSEGVEAAVPPIVRETVSALNALHAEEGAPVMITEIAKKLKLDKSSAWRRVRIAMERGYAKNLEDRKGRPARLVPGAPLPADVEILPAPERLSGCTVAGVQEGVNHKHILDDGTEEDERNPQRTPFQTTTTAQLQRRGVFAL
jgi:urease gamma subunit